MPGPTPAANYKVVLLGEGGQSNPYHACGSLLLHLCALFESEILLNLVVPVCSLCHLVCDYFRVSITRIVAVNLPF
jgi:hypothetical protein